MLYTWNIWFCKSTILQLKKQKTIESITLESWQPSLSFFFFPSSSLSFNSAFSSNCSLISLLPFIAKMACFWHPIFLGFLLYLTLLTTSYFFKLSLTCCYTLPLCYLFLPLWIFFPTSDFIYIVIVTVCMSALPSYFELSEHRYLCFPTPPPSTLSQPGRTSGEE